MERATSTALAEAFADQLGIDLTPEFVVQVDLVRYRLFLKGFSVRELRTGPSVPPAGFVFPPTSLFLERAERVESGDLAK